MMRSLPFLLLSLLVLSGCYARGYEGLGQAQPSPDAGDMDSAVQRDGALGDGATANPDAGMDATRPNPKGDGGDAKDASQAEGGAADSGTSDGGEHDAGHLDGGPEDAGTGELDAATDGGQSPVDAGSDASSTLSHCVGQASCTPTCAGLLGSCELSCTNAGDCSPTCPTATSCAITCLNTTECNVICGVGAMCDIVCDNSDCRGVLCGPGASCNFSCMNGAKCPEED